MIESPAAEVLTFGYSRVRTASRLRLFVEAQGIDHVVDVRLKRYSKTFEEFNGYHTGDSFDLIPGTSYEWVPDLGNLDYKSGGMRIANIDAIDQYVIPLIERGKVVALMCACWQWTTCHRTVVAREVAKRTGVTIRNL